MAETRSIPRYDSLVPKKPTSLLLDDERRADLKWLAAHLGISQAAVMALALGDFARKVRAEQGLPAKAATAPLRPKRAK